MTLKVVNFAIVKQTMQRFHMTSNCNIYRKMNLASLKSYRDNATSELIDPGKQHCIITLHNYCVIGYFCTNHSYIACLDYNKHITNTSIYAKT